MLKVLACECSGVDSLARGLLQEAEVKNWMDVLLHKGKEHCQTILERLPEKYHVSLEYRALLDYITNNETGAFTIIVGYDETHFYWEDIHSNAPIERTRAIAIAKRFA